MSKPESWKRIRSEEVANCRVFNVRKDFCENESSGDSASFYVIENPDWVNVIPITKSGELVLIEQFRHGTHDFTLEIPGGMVDHKETPAECAKRELEEETGYLTGDLIEIGRSSPNPALQYNRMYHFLATECEYTGKLGFDEHESISNRLVRVKEIPEMIRDGTIDHSLVIAAFHFLSLEGDIGNIEL